MVDCKDIQLADCQVQDSCSIRQAMEAIDRSATGIALVVDGYKRLGGVITDGDIRRALLGGARFEDPAAPYVRSDCTTVGAEACRADVLDLMRARNIEQVPILDTNGVLIGLHLLRDLVGAAIRKNWAVVMAGGRGERLRPLTDSIPKPMIRVAGRPILERIVLHLVGHGIRTIFLSVNYRADMIEAHFGDGSALGCEIRYLRERSPLGTGGALSLLPEEPADPLLVLNGDLLTQFNAGKMLAFHEAGGYLATVSYHDYVHTVPYGVLDLEGGRVAGMREKPSESWPANAGIYVLDPSLLARVPRDTHFSLPTLVEECLQRKEPVGAYRIEEDWIDVGRQHELRQAQGVVEEA